MALTESLMIDIGSPLPSFALPEPGSGRMVSSETLTGKPVLVAFICNHCPFVLLIREALGAFGHDYQPRGLQLIAINANDATAYPDDSPDKMAEFAAQSGFSFPYLYDESQSAAKAFGAVCTPDFFLFAPDGTLFYRGRFDEARPGNQIKPDGRDLRNAADALLEGRPAPALQQPSMGCNIKWKSADAGA
ncbi:thioredoxin family protein [Granulosicoccaceae sp. 1_MG-2023]|nr:thioredoxin family protein [Granulosicoccaceae sp. 1_MG-2023]